MWGQSTPPSGSFTAVNAGSCHTCGLRSDTTVARWGSDYGGAVTPPSGTFRTVSVGPGWIWIDEPVV